MASFSERAAINAPLQGAAADIIKRAMVRMNPALAAAGLKARMLLQVHDELVFEVPEAELETTAKVATKVMEMRGAACRAAGGRHRLGRQLGRRALNGGNAMKGDRDVITYLNKILKNELTSINQYFLHARMFRNWGFERLNKKEYQESIEEMQHADRLVERILFLEGLPNLQDLDRLHIGEDVPECLKADLALETRSREDLRAAIVHCESVRDFVSRELFEDILGDEEEHIDWLETQIGLIDRTGLENYLQSQMGEEGSD